MTTDDLTYNEMLRMLRPAARGLLHAMWLTLAAPVVCALRDHQWRWLWDAREGDDRLSTVGWKCDRCQRPFVAFCHVEPHPTEAGR